MDPTTFWSQIPPGTVFGLFIIGIATQLIIDAFRTLAGGGSNNTDHWSAQLVGRFGPALNIFVGIILGVITKNGVVVGLIGGGLSSWTWAFVNKLIQGK